MSEADLVTALRAQRQVGEGIGEGGAVAAADLLRGLGEEGVAAGFGDNAAAVELASGVEGGVVASDVPPPAG